MPASILNDRPAVVEREKPQGDDDGPIRVAFVVHTMQMAGAERLVVETMRRLDGRIRPTVLCLDALGLLGEELRARGADVETLGRRPGLDAHVPLRIASALRSRGVEVVHAHQYTPFFYSALAKLRLAGGVKIVLTEHGRHFPDVVAPRRRLVNRYWLARLADRVNAVCAFTANALAVNDGFPRERVEIIPNGVDPDAADLEGGRQAARRAAGLPADRRLVVSIARFHPVKDHETLVRAFAHVAGYLRDVDLLLAGDGPERPHIEQLTASLGIAPRVRFLGVRRDVPALLRAADAFCLTSLSEAASLTVLEAMAAPVPIVLTNVGGNPELVRHEREGLLVPRRDAASAGWALLEVLTNRALATRLAGAAWRRARAEFSLDSTIERYYQLYSDVVGRVAVSERRPLRATA